MQLVSLELPTAPPPQGTQRPPLNERPCRPCECGLAYIARRLGMADRPLRSIIYRLRLLVDNSSFPLPKTPRFVKGVRQTGSDAIDARSIWDRDAVDQWFDNDRPPHESRETVAARRAGVRDQLQRRLTLVASR